MGNLAARPRFFFIFKMFPYLFPIGNCIAKSAKIICKFLFLIIDQKVKNFSTSYQEKLETAIELTFNLLATNNGIMEISLMTKFAFNEEIFSHSIFT